MMIFENLVSTPKFSEKVVPYVNSVLFTCPEISFAVKKIGEYVHDYDLIPSYESLKLLISESEGQSADLISSSLEVVSEAEKGNHTGKHDHVFMLEQTEKYFRHRKCYLAVSRAIDVFEGEDKELAPGAVPELLSEAVSFKFDTDLTHSVSTEIEAHYERHYEKVIHKLPIHLETFNRITGGGPERKSFILFTSNQTGGFKTGIMCDWSANLFKMGYQCLYITFEMSEDKIRERIDANLLDTEIDDINKLSKEEYSSRMRRIVDQTQGRIEIKEWPEYGAHAGHIRYLLKEMKRSSGFRPDFIFVDYLNLASCHRLQGSRDAKEHKVLEVISKELRALSKEFDCCLVTATQSNRSGHRSGADNFDIDQTGESYGMNFSGDLVLGIINNEEMENSDRLGFKQFKNRWAAKSKQRVFMLGCVRAKMKLYDRVGDDKSLVESAQKPGNLLEERSKTRDASTFDTWKI